VDSVVVAQGMAQWWAHMYALCTFSCHTR